MRILIGSISLLLVLQACFSYARVIKKSKHVGHHHHKAKRGLEAFDVTTNDDCVDHTYCVKYSQMDCATFFVKNNCKSLCRLCGHRRTVKLPMVLYYNKHKAAAKKHVVRRAAKPTYPPTTSQTLFDYVGGYNQWNFHFTDKPHVSMDWSKPQPPATTADQTPNQANTQQYQQTAQANTQQDQQTAQANTQQDQQTTQANTQQAQQTAQAAPAADQTSYQAAPAQNKYTAPAASVPAASAYPAAQNAYQPQTASPEPNTAYQNQQPAAAVANSTATQAKDDTTTIKLPNSALAQANQGKEVYVALVDEKQRKPTYSLSAVQNDEPQKQKDDSPIQGFSYKPVKVKCPPGLECNYKGPDAPQVNQTFMVYCDDRFPSCGVLHSSCNDSWLQLYCPKRCNLCRPEDQQQTKPMQLDSTQQNASTPSDQQQQLTQFGNKVYPTKVTELKEDSPKMESELVAPEPGTKAERARYTLHVSPKLKDGVPQTQEILIMPPNAVPGSDVKPLVILKQRVTKPMVENIEIDVPPKGTRYSDEPRVEVIEGNKHESLNVVGGQADLSQAEADLSAGKTQQSQDATPTQTTPAETTAANTTTSGNNGNFTTPAPATTAYAAPATSAYAAPAQKPAAQTQEAQPAQDTQTQYSQSQTQTYQDTQNQATQSQAAQPAQSYQDTQAQATQTQAAQPEATQTQATQDQAQPQAAQTQATQSYAQAEATAAPTEAPATTAAAYPAQQDSQQTYTAAQVCSDDAICASYTDDMCSQNWLQSHCKSKCKLC